MTAAYVQLTTTAGSRDEADRIAGALLDARLAACAQIVGPVHSRYWWQGSQESAEEWLCVAKTTAERAPAAMDAIAAAHSYETPEITVTPIAGGSPAYLAWISGEVASDE